MSWLCHRRYIIQHFIVTKKLEINVKLRSISYTQIKTEILSILLDQQRHPNSENNLVRMNDVVFSVHGFLISLFILLQTCVYKVCAIVNLYKHKPYSCHAIIQKHESQQISSFAASFVWLAVMGSVLVISTIHYGGAIWLDFMYYLSSIKLIVSFIKYLPQVFLLGLYPLAKFTDIVLHYNRFG